MKLRKSLLLLLLGILVGTIGTALFLLKHPDYDPWKIRSPEKNIPRTSEEKLNIYLGSKNAMLRRNDQLVGVFPLQEDVFPKTLTQKSDTLELRFGEWLDFRAIEFPWQQWTGAILTLSALSGDLEAKVISKRHRSLKERQEAPDYNDDKFAYLRIKQGEEKVIDLDDYRNLHSPEQRATIGWVGFDIEIRPIGLVSTMKYKLDYKSD